MNEIRDNLIFSIRRWLSDHDFRRLLKIAKYLGRSEGASKFRLDINSIIEERLSIDDVIDLLDELDAEYSDDLINELERRLSYLKPRAVISFDGKYLLIEFNKYLGELYNELRDLIKYSKIEKRFKTLPYRYSELISKLKSLGFEVIDNTGFNTNTPLNIDVEFKGKLRDYQEEALNSWIKNHSRGVIALPTGSGKTVIAIAAIAKLKQRTLVIAYTKEQLNQWRDSILKFTNIPEYYIGLYYSKEKRLAPITLTTYQTAYRHVDKFMRYFPLLIIDEVHHLPADKFKLIATLMPSPYRMGLSATPYREDGRHVELFPLMGGIVYYKTPQELAEKGYLAQYKIVTIKVNLKPNEKKKLNELRRKYRSIVGSATFEEVLEAARQGNEKAIEALRIHNEMKLLIQKSEAKIEKVKEIIEKELSKGSKIIVFAHYVDLAERIAEEVGALLLTGNISMDKRKLILKKFRELSSGVLVVTTLGDEGLDIPDANVGILVAGTGSRRQFIQRLGRLLRPGKGKVSVLYEIVARGTSEELQSRRRKEFKLDEEFMS